jgi:hypothetical protein
MANRKKNISRLYKRIGWKIIKYVAYSWRAEKELTLLLTTEVSYPLNVLQTMENFLCSYGVMIWENQKNMIWDFQDILWVSY